MFHPTSGDCFTYHSPMPGTWWSQTLVGCSSSPCQSLDQRQGTPGKASNGNANGVLTLLKMMMNHHMCVRVCACINLKLINDKQVEEALLCPETIFLSSKVKIKLHKPDKVYAVAFELQRGWWLPTVFQSGPPSGLTEQVWTKGAFECRRVPEIMLVCASFKPHVPLMCVCGLVWHLTRH